MSKIYVSSTFVDLTEHRRAVSLAIRRLGHIDVAMEYYVAENLRPVDRSVRDASTCDLYLGIFARRYGYCPPGERCSITELEFRAAREANVDCLCFLVPDSDGDWPAEFTETGDSAGKLAALRAELSERYLSGFFHTPDELAAVASAAIVRNLDLGRAPFDAQREHRLIRSWRDRRSTPVERVRASQALVNMGSPRYAAAIKERVLDADAANVADIAAYLDELQRLASSRRELMPIFLDLLTHEQAGRRLFAVFQLGELGLRGKSLMPPIIDAVLRLTSDPDDDVRAELAHTLHKLIPSDRQHPGVAPALAQLTLDPSPQVRRQAERRSS